MQFGSYIREKRESLLLGDKSYSLRQMAVRVGVEPSYLSKVERGDELSPSEALVKKIAAELGEDSNVLLAMVGRVSSELRDIILARPVLFAELLEALKDSPEHAILRVSREVKDGCW